jgi:DNA polymerase-3 subunit delta'
MLLYKILLSQQFIHNKLPHAMLITGAQGVGKRILADWITGVILCQSPKKVDCSVQQEFKELILLQGKLPSYYLESCGGCKHCSLSQSYSYPDHLVLQSENNSIGVDDVRNANSFLEKKSHIGDYKTLLVPNADAMTVAASNALLKTLEEPTEKSIIILLSHESEMLLPTIISRCRLMHIKSLVGKKLFNKTGSNIRDEDNQFVNSTHIPELTDEAINLEYETFKQYYLSFLNTGDQETLLLAELRNNPNGLRWLEKITCNTQRELLLHNQVRQLSNHFISGDTLNSIYQLIINSHKNIKLYPQANKAFILEELLMLISEVAMPIGMVDKSKG